jgi:YVTN family beta-propeller protein
MVKKVYAPNLADGTVSVIDTAKNKVTSMVPIGREPYGIAVSPNGKKNNVTDSNNISVINTATNKVTAIVPVGDFPYGVAVTPDGKNVYVTNQIIGNPGIVSVINTTMNTVTARCQ